MCSTMSMPPFFQSDLTMNFSPQQDDIYAQYYAATYPPASQQQYSTMDAQVPLPQTAWIDNSMQTYPQPSFYESSPALQPQTSLPAQAPSFWTGATFAEEPSSYIQTAPALTLSPPQVSSEFDFNQLNNPIPTRHSRGLSFASVNSYDSYSSNNDGSPDASESNFSRSSSPGHADLSAYGYLNHQGTWSCAYPGCTSRAVFTRGCDLRKHHKRHTKSFFCRYPGCSQATGGGFSSKKDLARHEAKHNPGVVCEWDGCDRIFSRVDNMVSFILARKPRTSPNTLPTERSLQTHSPQGCPSLVCREIKPCLKMIYHFCSIPKFPKIYPCRYIYNFMVLQHHASAGVGPGSFLLLASSLYFLRLRSGLAIVCSHLPHRMYIAQNIQLLNFLQSPFATCQSRA
jgi:hypothetical protein